MAPFFMSENFIAYLKIEKRFSDALNADDLAEIKQIIVDNEIACPVSGSRNWTDVRQFNLMFDKETIELVEQKWVKDNLSSAVDIEHSSKLIEGVTFFESVLLNNERFATAKGFEGLPEGTWFLTGKVESDDVWTKIKSGEVNGVSIDGLFKTAEVNKVTMSDEQVIKIINNLKTLNVI